MSVGEETPSRLMLVHTTAPSQSDPYKHPNLDVIHVVGVNTERRLGLDTIIGNSVSSRTREYVFECNIARLLLGDLAFGEIEDQALQLLSDLVAAHDGGEDSSNLAQIFVAYDLGALIVKKAIAIAASQDSQWQEIFYSTVQFIWWGCFQRSRNVQTLDRKLSRFLHTHQQNAPWACLATSMSIRALAEASTETTEAFLASRASLRTRMVSIYTNEATNGMDPVLDFFTATFGVSTEIAVQENPPDEDGYISSLDEVVCYRRKNWTTHPRWMALQRMLLPLAMPQYQHTVELPATSPRVLESQAYKDWVTTPRSPVLYIQGRDGTSSRFLADDLALFEQKKLQEKKTYETQILSFRFSSDNTMHSTMHSVICSILIQVLTAFEPESPHPGTDVLLDLYRIQKGWTLKDLGNILTLVPEEYLQTSGFIVLHDVDECDLASRKYLWDLVQGLADRSDLPIKVVVTSQRRLSLLIDSDKSSLWNLYDYPEDTSELPLISRLCPAGYGETRVKTALRRLTDMNQASLEQIVCLIRGYTGWPDNPSSAAWFSFCTLLDTIQPSMSPATVLDQILRTVSDQLLGLRWILQWILHGHRPLSGSELAWLLHQYHWGHENRGISGPTSTETGKSLQLMKSKLSTFLHFGYNQVCVRDSLRDIFLEDDPIYMWNEIKPLALQTIEFLTFYLTRLEVRERLIEMYDQYILLYNASDNRLTPSAQPDGTDFIFYAITAFPYHLDRHPEFLQKLGPIFESPEQPLAPWARMCWAMDNPFSRPSEPVDSPITALLWTTLSVPLRKALISAMDTQLTRAKVSNAPQESNDITTMHLLAHAVSVGDEKATLEYVQRTLPRRASGGKASDDESISVSKDALEGHAWLSGLLWRAMWLNMDQLVELLLEIGVPPDPEDVVSARYPSPLYVASLCGHTRVVQALIQAGANTRVLKGDEIGIMYAAAAEGHSDTVRTLVAADRAFLELHQPNAPLYMAANCGKWRTVETLLDLGAQVDTNPEAGGWTPLISASLFGYIRTVRTLLEHGANPNLGGPGEQDTSLWFAALRGESVECVRALLEHGADPNHELLQPPLATEICSASHISTEKKIALLDCLVDNTPGIDLDRADPHGTTCLMWAASGDDTALVEWLLAHNVNVCATSEELRTALYYAVGNGNQQTIRALLAKGSPVNNVTSDGETLLQLSVGKGVEQMSLLLDAKADIELENGNNLTALNTAVMAEKPDVVKLLIERKANIHHRDGYGWSPIHDASYIRPNVEVVRLLVDAGANLTETVNSGKTPLHLAARDARPDIVAILLEYHGALDIEQRTENGETPLVHAVLGNNLECVRRLLQAGANINTQCSQGWTPLMESIYHSKSDEVTGLLLSQPGVDIHLFSPKHGAALHFACKVLNVAMVTELLDRRANVNQQVLGLRSTPIRAACLPENAPDSNTRHENLDKIDQIVRTLVAHGADVHAVSDTPISTLLCAAALNSGPSTINYLISEGLSLDQQDCLGRLPVHYAAANSHEVFEAILRDDSELLTEDVAGKTALHWAAQFGHVRTVESILAHARSPWERIKWVNRPDTDGWTALCWALRSCVDPGIAPLYGEPYDLTGTVQTLLEAGADVSIACRMGREDEIFTALELAQLHVVPAEVIRLLGDAEVTDSTEDKTIIWGPVIECQTCPDFHVCKKCHGRIDLYHGHVKQETGEPHEFKVIIEALPEIREQSKARDQLLSGDGRASPEGVNAPDGAQLDQPTIVNDSVMDAIMSFTMDDNIGEIETVLSR
ncbi:ankyrin repeat-containing domain protein [Aspergillus terreus]|uniref:Ankyrin repeat-containing domain protein n=1 Tax=Aspergillus terreus TaxID=33178 RepID=A0A5M3YV85_ASPTE|nr:hypothetical protein ATETN484_0004073100 [Aspergillus terreus]GFF13799.1 ankyrin repeat-containing domain protein [Aspergillus terreus]